MASKEKKEKKEKDKVDTPEDPEVQRKYATMVADFKKQCEESLRDQVDSWNRLLQSGQKNFQDLQQHYAGGNQELVNQMMKANAELINKLTKNYLELKQKLQTAHQDLLGQSKTNFDGRMEYFKTQCEETLKKITALSPKVHQDTMKELKEMQGKNAEQITKSYNTMIEHLDKAFENTVKQLKFQHAGSAAGTTSSAPTKSK